MSFHLERKLGDATGSLTDSIHEPKDEVSPTLHKELGRGTLGNFPLDRDRDVLSSILANDTFPPDDELTEEWLCLHYGSTTLLSPDEDLTGNLVHGNLTMTNEFNGSAPGELVEMGTRLTCNRSWDGVLCWPEVYEGSSATLSCFSHLNGIPYDTSG